MKMERANSDDSVFHSELTVNTAVEYEWFNEIMNCIQRNSEQKNISWSGYLAVADENCQPLPARKIPAHYYHAAFVS